MNTKDWLYVLLLFILIGSIVIGILYLLNKYSCSSKAKIQELQYSYNLVQGCMVRESNGKWIDYNRYIVLK